MKPLKLIMQGFGAFPDNTEIDFQHIGADSLFLVCGPTGAGKTTIFDGLCYALFGESTGKRQSSDMRSQYSSVTTKSYVEFSFALGSDQYLIHRDLSYETSEKKVDGKVILKILDQAGNEKQAPITKIREVESYIGQLLGMNAKEFRQIVMLPQGEFEKFLLAKSSDREVVLGNLFRTSFYALIANRLQEKAKSLKQIYDNLLSKKETLLLGGGVERKEELEQRIQQQLTEELSLKGDLQGIQYKLTEARNMRIKAEQLDKYFSEYRQAQVDFDEHLQKEGEIKDKTSILERANVAEQFRTTIADIEKMQTDFNNLGIKNTNLSKDEKSLQSSLQTAELKLKRLEDQAIEISGKQSEKQNLQRLLPKVKELDGITKEIGNSKTLLLKAQDNRKLLVQEGEQKQARGDEIQEQLPLLHERVKEKGRVEAQTEDITNKLKLIREKQSSSNDLKTVEENLKNKLKLLDDASKNKIAIDQSFQEMDIRWRRSQAARLAIDLQPEQPCPVCGSIDHPSLAPKTDDFVTTEELDEAKQNLDKALEKWNNAKQQLDDANHQQKILLQKVQLLNEQLGSYSKSGSADLQRDLDALQIQLKDCSKKETEIKLLTAEVDACNKRIKEITAEKSIIETTIVAQGQKKVSLEEKERGIRSDLPSDISSLGELELQSGKLEKELTSYEKDRTTAQGDRDRIKIQYTEISARLDESRNLYGSIDKELNERIRTLIEKTKNAKFQSIDELKTFLIEGDQRDMLDRLLEAWKEKKIQLETKRKEAFKKIDGCSNPDIVNLKTIEQNMELEDITCRDNIVKLSERVKGDRSLVSKVVEVEKEIIKIHIETTTLDNLARIANGENILKQPLQTFVLTAFLEDVINAANLRLSRLTHKRYELTRRTDPVGRQRKSGLDLNVFDNHTGEERPAHTLSGGEMFLTSLSLALGLADVVSVHTGGIKLDAMFIDEGFGSLDDQTLDVAIQALIDLKEDGRMIGIISHVNELKERIPLRLEVIKSRKGSSVKWSRN
jgi:exonuclease SbcC